MPVPIIPATYWLEKNNIADIDALVCNMIDRIAAGQAPIHQASPKIRNVPITSAGCSFAVRPRDIKGEYNRFSMRLNLTDCPTSSDTNKGFCDELYKDIPYLRIALRGVLAHETSHIRQHQLAKGVLDSDFGSAESASKTASDTMSYSDYLNYISQPVELAAHATQSALEVLDSYGRRLTQVTFIKKCIQTWVYRRAWQDTRFVGSTVESQGQAFIAVGQEWYHQAWFAYRRL